MKRLHLKYHKFDITNAIHHSLHVFGSRLWACYYRDGFGWFRIFGVGLIWKNINHNELTFSERNGYSKRIYIGNYCIGFLLRN